jgi:hypothetical protein
MIDYPETTEHGLPLPWVQETQYTDPVGSLSPPIYQLLWLGLGVDFSLLFTIAAIICFAVQRAERKRKRRWR